MSTSGDVLRLVPYITGEKKLSRRANPNTWHAGASFSFLVKLALHGRKN